MVVEPLADDPAASAEDRAWMGRAFAIARAAVTQGNHPFGALLVLERDVLGEFHNAVVTTGDVTRHAETGLVGLVTPQYGVDVLARATMYTSTEPCIMCCGAIHWSGIGRIVYGVTSSQMSAVIGRDHRGIPCREALERMGSAIVVNGPVMESEGLATHRDFWPDFLGRMSES